MEDIFHSDELRNFALHEQAHRNSGPLGDDLGDVLFVDLFLQYLLVGLELVRRMSIHSISASSSRIVP